MQLTLIIMQHSHNSLSYYSIYFIFFLYKNGKRFKGGVFLKIKIEQISSGENEIIVKCQHIDSEVQQLLNYLKGSIEKIVVHNDNEKILISPDDVFYVESVDNKTFVYTDDAVMESQDTLFYIENKYSDMGLIRIGKSQLVNLHHIKKLKSIMNSRIEITLESDERLVVSRHYARAFKSRLEIDI